MNEPIAPVVTRYQAIAAAVRNSRFQPQFILIGSQKDLDDIISANPGVVDTGKAVREDGTEVTFSWFKDLGVIIVICPVVTSFELVATVPQKLPTPTFHIVKPR